MFPAALAANATFLNRTDMVAKPLPASQLPTSPDFVNGSYNMRLMDAGDCQLFFPNGVASDGTKYRQLFDPNYHLQWVEVYSDAYLEGVYCITKVIQQRDSIEVDGVDGFFMLKMAYERDWICTQAPRDVIERGSRLWTPTIKDSFPQGTALNARWTNVSSGGGSAIIGPNGGLVLAAPGGGGIGEIQSGVLAVNSVDTWSAEVDFSTVFIGPGGPPLGNSQVVLTITESSGDTYTLNLGADVSDMLYATLVDANGQEAQLQPQTAPAYSLLLESDGEWVWAFVNGVLVGGCARGRGHPTTSTLRVTLSVLGNQSLIAVCAENLLVEAQVPYLMTADKGDYVLPGSAATYPTGGLHARYSNDLDIQNDANRLFKIQHPMRSQAYQSTGVGEYQNQQDATINGQANPTPGAGSSNWSVCWFGAIYLQLASGDYTFSVTTPVASTAVRVSIGKTTASGFILDQWTFQATHTFSFTLVSTQLSGRGSYGGPLVRRNGWYPIKVEYAVDGTTALAPVFKLTNSPAGYTDPGGTVIASGAQSTVVPATSLSPLGCVDQRFQGVSHFDMVQQQSIAAGYQVGFEPKEFESGVFPGVVAPRVREGSDYDTVLETDDRTRPDPMMDYSNTNDATDQAVSLRGNGAGTQTGSQGQLQARVYDPLSLDLALFDIQGWQDFSDAAFSALLQQLLNSQLGLKLLPWQTLASSPMGRHRLASTWPLPGAIAQQRWRPGDGMRVHAESVSVNDTVPRQLWLVNRQILPNGTQQCQVGFAGQPNSLNPLANYGKGIVRPRTPQWVVQKAISAVTRLQRNRQRTQSTLSGNFVTGAVGPGALGGFSVVSLQPGDTIVNAYLRVTGSTVAVPFDAVINGVDQTNTLGSTVGTGWTKVPLVINLNPVQAVGPGNNLTAALLNNSGATTSTLQYQLFVDVLR